MNKRKALGNITMLHNNLNLEFFSFLFFVELLMKFLTYLIPMTNLHEKNK